MMTESTTDDARSPQFGASPVRQCASCKWSMPLEERYNQLLCTNDDSTEAWGNVEATGCCKSFVPNARTGRQPPGEAAACNNNSQTTQDAETGKRGRCSLQWPGSAQKDKYAMQM